MIQKILSTLHWLPSYIKREASRSLSGEKIKPKHVYFCICDHFEPYWNKADSKTAGKRIKRWLDEYPKIAEKYRDSEGNVLKYSFFYPQEEYQENDLNALAGLCHAGYGEVEIHLHHDNDTADNFRRTLIDYKKRLHEKHGLLSRNRKTGEISYGFIHGNWALNNSRPDGCWCGVNNETSILLETGCYADFTMPSAPDVTQTSKVNSIYYAIDNPEKPKSHDTGRDVEVGKKGGGLLMIQGPLGLSWHKPKYGVLPRIENGGIYANNPPTMKRIASWLDCNVHVDGVLKHVFIKIYTHGTQEGVMKALFDKNGFERLFEGLAEISEQKGIKLHYLSARETANMVLALESGLTNYPPEMRNFRYVSCK